MSGPIFVAGHTDLPQPLGARAPHSAGVPLRTSPGSRTGAVALIQRGTCPFTQKYENAFEAGAAAVLILNDGFEDREAPIAHDRDVRQHDPRRDDQQ